MIKGIGSLYEAQYKYLNELSVVEIWESSLGRWWGREGYFAGIREMGSREKKLLPLTECMLILSFNIYRIQVVIINSDFIML